jgi:ribosomal protein L29
MNSTELAQLTDEQLVHRELELERSLVTATFRHRIGRLENTSQLGRDRRDIARAQTELRARERRGDLPKGSLRARHAGSYRPTAAATPGAEAGAGFLKGILDKGPAAE